MSGLNQQFAKLSYGVNPYRGFKSPLLRHLKFSIQNTVGSILNSIRNPEYRKNELTDLSSLQITRHHNRGLTKILLKSYCDGL